MDCLRVSSEAGVRFVLSALRDLLWNTARSLLDWPIFDDLDNLSELIEWQRKNAKETRKVVVNRSSQSL